jgi:succinyl-diaminopimelate desuccinylase
MMKYQAELEAYLSGKEAELVAATARLVNIPSTKGEAAPGAPFGVGPAAALEESLKLGQEWGLTATNYDGYVSTFDVNDKDTNLNILCHLDVVDPGEGWDTDPYQLVEKDGMIYGRGVDDDKGPAAISMLAMRAVKELGIPLKHNVRLILGTDEESGSEDIAYYFSKEPFAPYTFSPDAEFPVINIEKGSYKPVISAQWEEETALPRVASIDGGIRINVVAPIAKAVVLGGTPQLMAPYFAQASAATGAKFSAKPVDGGVEVTVLGENAHASTPSGGNNAITALLVLLCHLPLAECASTQAVHGLRTLFPHGDYHGKALGIAQEDEISHDLTMTLTLLTLNATGFSAQFDSRTPICANDENCKQVCEAACAAQGFSCVGQMHAPHHTPAESPFIQTLLQCYEIYSGREGFCQAIGGGTYVHEIPGGVAFGAGNLDFDSRLHAANERARISSMMMAVKIYAQAIIELCGE